VNMASVASLIARTALSRRESRGAHYRSDFPARDDGRFGHSSILAIGEEPSLLKGELLIGR